MTSVKPKVLPIIELIQKGTEFLSKAGITNAKLEIEWFLSDLLNCDRIDLYVRFDEPLIPQQIEKLRQFLKRRKAREPFQYIMGKAAFYGRDFMVTPDVLIPRPETEILIDILKTKTEIRSCLEVGTGSGCIAISAILEVCIHECTAIDISEKALSAATKNAEKFNVNSIKFECMDFLIKTPKSKFDVILSNPPYVSEDEMQTLEPELAFEPESALTDYSDGLTFYLRFAETADDLLEPNGILLLEIGDTADKNDIIRIFADRGYSIQFHEDLKKVKRVAEISKC